MKKMSEAEMQRIFDVAMHAGLNAGNAVNPTPMHLRGGGKSFVVSEGACGFAWVTIRPANCRFANFLKKKGLARNAYGGGVQIWISAHGQSIARKEAHADAMAEVIRSAGIERCYAGSRLD